MNYVIYISIQMRTRGREIFVDIINAPRPRNTGAHLREINASHQYYYSSGGGENATRSEI